MGRQDNACICSQLGEEQNFAALNSTANQRQVCPHFVSNPWEAEADRPLSLRPVCSTE